MRTSDRTFRNVTCFVFPLMISIALAACGSGGGSTTSSGGPASASVSVASAPDFPAGTTFAVATASPTGTSAPVTQPTFNNVLVTVTKVALIPSTGGESPDRDGQLEAEDSPQEDGSSGMPGFVTAVLPHPVVFDLLHPPTGRQVAKLLNRFPDIPAGEYSKIRVYYVNVVGVKADNTVVPFHPTAHYHFDVHFVGGNLIVPVATDPAGGIRFYSVVINVVEGGLKYHQAGQSGNVLLRPQVFATVDNSLLKYLVSGVARNVNPADNTFNIITSGDTPVTIPAAYSATMDWIYIDNTVDPVRKSNLANLGAKGLDNGAIVDVIGTFSSDNVLLATEVDITFPDVKDGVVDNHWGVDNTFLLRLATDNVVFPKPSRGTAYYDNAVDFAPLSDASIVDNAAIIARGYKVAGGIKAFWISIGGAAPGP